MLCSVAATDFWLAERRLVLMQEAEDALAPLLRCLAGMLKNDGGGLPPRSR